MQVFKDINGETYSGDLVYFQPDDICYNTDVNGLDYRSFDVWKSFHACKALFPMSDILAYSGSEIEEPRFVD